MNNVENWLYTLSINHLIWHASPTAVDLVLILLVSKSLLITVTKSVSAEV